jgi:hypothetical protein
VDLAETGAESRYVRLLVDEVDIQLGVDPARCYCVATYALFAMVS